MGARLPQAFLEACVGPAQAPRAFTTFVDCAFHSEGTIQSGGGKAGDLEVSHT